MLSVSGKLSGKITVERVQQVEQDSAVKSACSGNELLERGTRSDKMGW